jgi:hypothetical protein
MKITKLFLGVVFVSLCLGAEIVPKAPVCFKWVKTKVVHKRLSKKRVDEILAWNKANPRWHPLSKKETLHKVNVACGVLMDHPYPVHYYTYEYAPIDGSDEGNTYLDYMFSPVDTLDAEIRAMLPEEPLPSYTPDAVDVPMYSFLQYPYLPYFVDVPVHTSSAVTPEPNTLALMGTGLISFALLGIKLKG